MTGRNDSQNTNKPNKAGSVFDRVLNFFAAVAGILIVLIVVGVTIDVIMRYFFQSPIYWMIEVVSYSLAYVTFFGSAWLLAKNRHVIIDLVVNSFEPKKQLILNTFTSILGGIVFILVTYFSGIATLDIIQKGVRISSQLGPPQFILLLPVTLGSLLLTVQFWRRTYSYLKRMKGKI